MAKKSRQAPRGTTKSDGMQKLKDAYTGFVDRLEALVQDARKQAQDAHRECSRALADMDESFAKQRTERLQHYLDSLEKSHGEREDRKLLRSARSSVEDELEKLQENLGKRYDGVLSKRQQELEAARQEAHDKIQKAFQDYLTSVRESWVEIRTAEPEEVVVLGEMLSTAALKTRSLLET